MSREHTSAATQAAPSPSLIHFFWTGKMPSQKLKRHLLHWQHYLSHQNSEFRVCLWVTGDLYDKMRENQHAKKDADGDMAIGTPSIKIKNIDPLFAEAAIAYPELTEICRKLIQAKLYSFVSSFARMLILNAFPGFYCDTDIYPTTTPGIDFPVTLDALRAYYPQDNTHAIFCYHNVIGIENQIMLSLFADAFSHRLKSKNAEIAELKSNPNSPYSNLDAFIRAHQTATDKLKSILSDDPFLRKNAKWIVDFKKPSKYRKKETYTVSTNEEIIKISEAQSLFELFYKLSITYYDSKYAEKHYPTLYNVIQRCFRNPIQDKSNVYAWSHPIHFHLEQLRQSANTLGEQYKKRIVKRGNARLFTEPRTIPATANVNTLHKAVAERDWYYATALAQALQTQLSSDVITQSLSNILAENSPLPWTEAQVHYVNFLCDHCDKENETQQAIMSAVIKLALLCAKERNILSVEIMRITLQFLETNNISECIYFFTSLEKEYQFELISMLLNFEPYHLHIFFCLSAFFLESENKIYSRKNHSQILIGSKICRLSFLARYLKILTESTISFPMELEDTLKLRTGIKQTQMNSYLKSTMRN